MAFFPAPKKGFQQGGAHIAVHLVPVYEGRLVAFEVTARGAEGRWLPWAVLDYQGNPYEHAAALVDDWCQGHVRDLRLVDVMSSEAEGSWELAIVFRAELTAYPVPDGPRAPVGLQPPLGESLNRLPALELDRWLALTPPPEVAPDPAPHADDGPRLVF